MAQVQATALRKAFLLNKDGRSGKAAYAMHSLMQTIETQIGPSAYTPAIHTQTAKRLAWGDKALKAEFGLCATDISCRLGLLASTEQVHKAPDEPDFNAFVAYPELFSTSQAGTYMLSVPVRYNGTYFCPFDSKAIADADFIPAGAGLIAIRGVGNVITPAILSLKDEPVALPPAFDAGSHDWVLNPYLKQPEPTPRTP